MRSNLFMRWAILACIVGSVGPRTSDGQEPKKEELSAQEIVDRMATTYAECKSYQDTGVVQTVFIHPNNRRTDRKPFMTAFLAQDRFRFAYKTIRAGGDESQQIIWRQGADVQTWWDVRPGIEKPRSLEFALSAAHGVSSKSSGRIPRLLMSEELGGVQRWGLGRLKRLPDEKLGTFDCYRIEGTLYSLRPKVTSKGLDPTEVKAAEEAVREVLKAKGVSEDVIQRSVQAVKLAQQAPQNAVNGPQVLWIDKASFLVRRIDEQTTFDNFRTETTTTYEPVLDGPVGDQQLAFDPPQR